MTDSTHPPQVVIAIDDRERKSGLADAIRAFGSEVTIQRLAVGDVAIGSRVIVERKTVGDFTRSIDDRRVFDQAYALRGACSRPLIVVEGFEPARFSATSIRAVMASLLVGYGIPMLRTESLEESAMWIDLIARRETQRLARRTRSVREHAAAETAIEVLSAIPGVGPLRARNLVDSVGTPGAVLSSDERALRQVPGIGPVTAARIRDLGAPPNPASP